MVKVIGKSHAADAAHHSAQARPHDWRKAMSDNVALALLVYTGLQIFMTVHAMRTGMHSIAPYVMLVLLVGGIIPFCRKYEHRWTELSDEHAADPSLAPAFRRDQVALWAMALGLPVVLTGFFKVVFA